MISRWLRCIQLSTLLGQGMNKILMNSHDIQIHFSLVMGTVGRTEEITQFLSSLAQQSYKNFELIIVDQNLDDRLVPAIQRFAKLFRIIHLASQKGLSRARNIGLKEVTGNVIAFPDDDCLYLPDTLLMVATELAQNPMLDGITGRFTDLNGNSEGRWLSYNQTLTRYTVWRGAISFSIFLRKSLTDKVGLFNELLGVGAGTPWGAGEETEYLLRALQLNANLKFRYDLVLRHPLKAKNYDIEARERQARYETGFGSVIRQSKYPIWYFAWTCARTFAGCGIALARLRSDQAHFKWISVKARLNGYINPAFNIIPDNIKDKK